MDNAQLAHDLGRKAAKDALDAIARTGSLASVFDDRLGTAAISYAFAIILAKIEAIRSEEPILGKTIDELCLVHLEDERASYRASRDKARAKAGRP